MLSRRRLRLRGGALAGAAVALAALFATRSASADDRPAHGLWWGVTTFEIMGVGAAPLIAQPKTSLQVAGTVMLALGVPTGFGIGYLAHRYEWSPAPPQALHGALL